MVVAANARLHVSQPARHHVLLQTRAVKKSNILKLIAI